MKLTSEQKTRFAPMLCRTYRAIGADAACTSRAEIIEVTCDANHPEMYGGMSREEYDILCQAYSDRDTQKWLRQVLNY